MMAQKDLKITYKNSAGEEDHPQRQDDFPYVRIHSDLGYYADGVVAWHWHNDVELFLVEKGTMVYHIPGKTVTFPAGSVGFVNSGVLHMVTLGAGKTSTDHYVHIFDPYMLSGSQTVLEKYIDPLLNDPSLPIASVSPGTEESDHFIAELRDSFWMTEKPCSELKIQSALTQLRQDLLPLAAVQHDDAMSEDSHEMQIKAMMMHVYEHYAERIDMHNHLAYWNKETYSWCSKA